MFDKIEAVIEDFGKLEGIKSEDVVSWLLGWINFFPEESKSTKFAEEKLRKILDLYQTSRMTSTEKHEE